MLAKHAPQLNTEREWFSEMLLDKNYTVPEARVRPNTMAGATNDNYFQARYEMTMTACRRKCMHLNCPVDPDTPVTTMLCAQCGVVSYCSTSCHRAAWNAECCPHKDVCTILARMREKLDLGRPPRTHSAADKPAKQDTRAIDGEWRKWLMRTTATDCRVVLVSKGVTPRTCRAIWLYFLQLNRAKGLNPPFKMEVPMNLWKEESLDTMKTRYGTAYIEDFETAELEII
ncbi:hypothetical protein B0H16DRAFT_1879782 [Mycena metata]|uniref:MYND-type domain-containing protein n=1 Tax=Mycena metata TaxID=1033252 RepID=A0AAD7JZX3_9AGAR|nr:hypothetical protein B0H16DRAFT_1879782 [Mycena metata]